MIEAADTTSALAAMRAQITQIQMTTDTSFLSVEEREVVNLLNEAANLMSEIYLRQVSEQNPEWRDAIVAGASPDGEMLLDLFNLHFGPWDTLNHNAPFWGTTQRPEGAAYYPSDMTKAEFEAWITAHPDQMPAFTSGYTLIRRTDEGGLEAIPYSVAYAEWLVPSCGFIAPGGGDNQE